MNSLKKLVVSVLHFARRNWAKLGALMTFPVVLTLIGMGLDASYQSGSRSEPTDVRLQPIQGIPMGVVTETSTKCNEQRLREGMGDKSRRGGIDYCAELVKMNQKNGNGGGQFRAVFTNKGPEVIENLTAELVLELNEGTVVTERLDREAMGVDEYERVVVAAASGFISRATLCLTFDRPWGRRRNLVYALSSHERSPTMEFFTGGERKFQLRRTKGFFPIPMLRPSSPRCEMAALQRK